MVLRNPSRILLGLAALASAAAMTATAAAPSAKAASLGVACPDPTYTPFNDGHRYAAVPDGGFENGAAGWTLTGGARVVTGNESDMVGGPGQSHSLSLPTGSSATSPPMCIGLLSSQMRLYMQNAGAAGSNLRIQVIYNGGVGAVLGGLGSTLRISDEGTFAVGNAWTTPTALQMVGGILPLLTQSVQFKFTPLSTGGNWRIDDVYLDPLMHR